MSLTPNLTPNETKIYEFLRSYLERKGFVPTFEEIRQKFELKSLSSVQQYIAQLETKGYIRNPGGSKKRALEILKVRGESQTTIPLLGKVAAGFPLESIKHNETVDVSPDMLSPTGEFFALQVKGDSMINDGIIEDDIVIIKKQPTAFNGQTVVALIDNEATIKCFFKKKDCIELHSANPKYKPIIVHPDQSFNIEGILHGLIRKFKR